MNNLLAGNKLSPKDQQSVLNSFVHRFTKEHNPQWTSVHLNYNPQFSSDADWLEHSRFYVKTNGRLDKRYSHCQSSPTWPDGKGLIVDNGADND